MTATLVCHVDSKKVALDVLRSVATPAPTASWHPIGHAELVDLVSPVIQANGLQIGSQQFALSNDRNKMFGVFDIVNADNADASVSFAMGIRNSIDKTLPAGLSFGARVFVCDNLSFSGEVTVARRHTKNVLDDLPAILREKVAMFSTFRDGHYRLFDVLKTVELSRDEIAGMILNAYRLGAISKTRIADVFDELENETHLEKHGGSAFGGPLSAWSLYNAGTEVMKGRQAKNLIEASGESIVWHKIFSDRYADRTKIVVSVPSAPLVPAAPAMLALPATPAAIEAATATVIEVTEPNSVVETTVAVEPLVETPGVEAAVIEAADLQILAAKNEGMVAN